MKELRFFVVAMDFAYIYTVTVTVSYYYFGCGHE